MADIDFLEGLSEKRLAEIWCELNNWGWPEEVPNPEKILKFNNPRRSILRNYIQGAIGFKKCNRQWNIDSMTDDEHEIWYGENFAS